MPHPNIDYRSDLLVPPSPAIKAAIAEAMGHSPEFELRGGPDQVELERQTAELLGKESALLFPTCTMANQTALILHCRPGDAAIAEQEAHMITSEGGAPGSLAGAIVHGVAGTKGLPDIDTVTSLINTPDNPIAPRITALLLENTHLRSGGRVLGFKQCAKLRAITAEAGVAIHLDGARLFNAAVASGKPLHELAVIADSVSLSLNKGLGAPFGAMLAGSEDLINQALRVRHRLGGGFRPTGIVSAAALAALKSFKHIGDDHRRSRELAAALDKLPGLSVAPVETNIVFVSLDRAPKDIVEKLHLHGVKVLPYGSKRIRLVTHGGIDDDKIARTVQAFKTIAVTE